MHFFCQKPPETRLLFEILNIKRQSHSLEEAISDIGHQVTFTAPGTGHIDVYEPPAPATASRAPTDPELSPAPPLDRRNMRSNHASPCGSTKMLLKSRPNSSMKLVEQIEKTAAALDAVKEKEEREEREDREETVEREEREKEEKRKRNENGQVDEEGEGGEMPGRSRGGFRDTGSVKAASKSMTSSVPPPMLSGGENEGKFRGSVKGRRRTSVGAGGAGAGAGSGPSDDCASLGANHGKDSVSAHQPGTLGRNQSWSLVKLLTNPFKHITKGHK
jgi:hypothetical protein